MTTQLTNEQIARVFAMYYPQKVQGFKEWSEEKGYWYPYLELDSMAHALKQMSIGLMNFKLLLTPLSSISDEDAIEVGKIFFQGETFKIKKYETRIDIVGENYLVSVWPDEFQCDTYYRERYKSDKKLNTAHYKVLWAHQFLIQRGYAVPLFIEPNHPLNGKTAIELGLAIDKTKEVSHG